MPKNVINKNTYNITNEIDYKKLAKAIMETQDNKKEEESFTALTFSFLCTLVFGTMGLIMVIFTLIIISIPWAAYFGYLEERYDYLTMLVPILLITALGTLLSVLFIKSAIECYKEKEKSFLVSLFSSLTSIAAMVIAAISLYYTFITK